MCQVLTILPFTFMQLDVGFLIPGYTKDSFGSAQVASLCSTLVAATTGEGVL